MGFNTKMAAISGSPNAAPADPSEETYVDLCGNGKNRVYSGEAMDFTSSSVTQLCAVDFKGPKNDRKYIVHHMSTSLSYEMSIDPITHEHLKSQKTVKADMKQNSLLNKKTKNIIEEAKGTQKLESKALKRLNKLIEKMKAYGIYDDDGDDDDHEGEVSLSTRLK